MYSNINWENVDRVPVLGTYTQGFTDAAEKLRYLQANSH